MTNRREALWLLTLGAPLGAAGASVVNLDYLCRHWVRSHEEEPRAGSEQIFRPAGFDGLPQSRFRMAYKFKRNGDCDWLYLSPDDAHHFKPGKWRLNTQGQLQITADGATVSYRVLECTKQSLRLAPRSSTR